MLPSVSRFSRFNISSPVTTRYATDIYAILYKNYVAVATVIFVVAISFFIPDITQKLQATQEIKNLKKTLNKISTEVRQAEVACLAVADEICCFNCALPEDCAETSKELRDLSLCTNQNLRTTQSAPVQIEEKIGLFRRIFFPRRPAPHKEITIMSYVYTDSFDGHEHVIPPSE